MRAIQFETVVEDNTIRIPEQFRVAVHERKVQVTIRDEYASENKNALAWQKFLQNIKDCDNQEALEFERVNFDRSIDI